jgi:hypothetical protein
MINQLLECRVVDGSITNVGEICWDTRPRDNIPVIHSKCDICADTAHKRGQCHSSSAQKLHLDGFSKAKEH